MSGPVLICVDRDTPVDRGLLRHWLRQDYYRQSREENYRFLQPKIIVEEFFSEDGLTLPRDYKVFCFHGCPKLIEVDADRFRNHTRSFYDTEWRRLGVTVKYPAGRHDDPRPRNLDLMLHVARELSKPFSSIRVDLYAHDREVRVGELTNCHGGGGEAVHPRAAERWLGDLFMREPATGGDSLAAGLYGETGMGS